MSTQTSGYSGTPLAKKLGITEGSIVVTIQAPKNYTELLSPLPENVVFQNKVSQKTTIVHLFSDDKSHLKTWLEKLRTSIRPDGMVWVSWPKKADLVKKW